jgi:DnaK suppressor protein
MTRRDTLLWLHKTLLARGDALRKALAGELENACRRGADQTGDSDDGACDCGSNEMSAQLAELVVRDLSQIERALTRLKQGTYGICEVCQGKIPITRLNALPSSTTCVNCQRKMKNSRGWVNIALGFLD